MSTMEQSAAPIPGLVAVDGRQYPLESARIDARTEGGMAFSTLTQIFANPHDQPLEVVYTLSLPADGAILGFRAVIGEKVIESRVMPRDEASEEYREALYTGKIAGLMEQLRDDTFRQQLGNVPPHTRVQVAIEVLHPLAFLTGATAEAPARSAPEWEYRFPTVAGVRYLGEPGRVVDAGDLSPDRGTHGAIPTRMELSLTIGGAPATSVRSSSHVITQQPGEGGTVIGFVDARLDRDVVVSWDAVGAELGVTLIEGRGLPGDDGRYALITLVPPVIPAATFHRDLTVLIDASGSMSGEPLEFAKRVVGELLGSLDEHDRFELLAFSSSVERLTSGRGLVPGDSKAVGRAQHALAALQAGGGTEMVTAMKEALAPIRGGAQRQVVLVTDGYVGFENEVLYAIQGREGSRVHVVGIGSAPNRTLTRSVANAGHGLELLVGDDAGGRRAAQRLIAGTARPVLVNLVARGSACVDDSAMTGDVFAGRPLVFTAELRPEGGDLELVADLAGTNERWVWRVHVPSAARSQTTLPIGALHGRQMLTRLELHPSMDEEIERVAMRHRIASRLTSLVAIADEPSVDPRAPRRRTRLAIEVPAGVSGRSVGLDSSLFFAGSGSMMHRAVTEFHAPRLRGNWPLRSAAIAAAYAPADVPAQAAWRPEPDVVVIELEVRDPGLPLPTGSMTVELEQSGQTLRADAEVVGGLSSDSGPHPQGTIVKLALRIVSPGEWPAGAAARISWGSLRIRFTVPGWSAPGHPAT